MNTQIRQENGVSILEPNGRIMGPSAIELRETIVPHIENSDSPRILINFDKINMIDSSGLGALLEARALTIRKKGRIGVVHVSKGIKNLVALSRLVSMFENYDSVDDAVSALSE